MEPDIQALLQVESFLQLLTVLGVFFIQQGARTRDRQIASMEKGAMPVIKDFGEQSLKCLKEIQRTSEEASGIASQEQRQNAKVVYLLEQINNRLEDLQRQINKDND